jgi:LuxR family transcriptional regulator, quorum-sensing system regulator CviR
MGEPLRVDRNISEDKLQNAFPFIRLGGGRHAFRREPPQDSRQFPHQDQSSDRVQRRPFPAESFKDFTKRELQAVLEILHYSTEARTGDDVYQVLQLIQRAVACPHVIGGIARLNSKGTFEEFNSVINVSYSNDWLYAYGGNGYAAVDPVLRSLLSTFKTQIWEQTYQTANSPKQIEFMEEARSYGLTHGITTGMLEQGRGFASFFSFAGGESDGANRYVRVIEYLLPYLHRVLMANANTPSANRLKGLSPREMAVLEWMKQGKTNWEISRIIGVSERTVRFHAESIFMKLDVGSRTQAVAVAIEQCLIPGA